MDLLELPPTPADRLPWEQTPIASGGPFGGPVLVRASQVVAQRLTGPREAPLHVRDWAAPAPATRLVRADVVRCLAVVRRIAGRARDPGPELVGAMPKNLALILPCHNAATRLAPAEFLALASRRPDRSLLFVVDVVVLGCIAPARKPPRSAVGEIG